jgi:hypothetical protein
MTDLVMFALATLLSLQFPLLQLPDQLPSQLRIRLPLQGEGGVAPKISSLVTLVGALKVSPIAKVVAEPGFPAVPNRTALLDGVNVPKTLVDVVTLGRVRVIHGTSNANKLRSNEERYQYVRNKKIDVLVCN